VPNCVNSLHIQPLLLFQDIKDIIFDCYDFCCWNKKLLNCSRLLENSFMQLLYSILMLFTDQEKVISVEYPRRTIHFQKGTPYRLRLIGALVCLLITTFVYTNLVFHTSLFRSMNLNDIWLMHSFSFSPAHNIRLLFIGFYQPHCHLRT
jgi:hypothetical protein